MGAFLCSILTAGICVAATSSGASVDLTYSFADRTFTNGYGLDQIFTAAQFSGTLTDASIDVAFLGGNMPPMLVNDLAIWIQKPIAGGWATIRGRYGLDSQLYSWPGGQNGTRAQGSSAAWRLALPCRQLTASILESRGRGIPAHSQELGVVR